MLIRDSDYVDGGNSWQKLKEEVEASTHNENQNVTKLTQIVVGGLLSQFAKESIEENLKLKKKKRTYDQGGEKEACLIRKKQKKPMIIREKGVKRCVGTSGEERKDEDYLLSKQKKQKGNDKKNHKQKNLSEATALLALEPRPIDIPEAFKNCIENLGGTQIKLVFHKIIYATDLSKSHNRLSMSKTQVRNNFLSEEEERIVSPDKGGMDVILVEPRLKVSRVRLAKWRIGENEAYVFKSQWYRVVCDNPHTLKPKAAVQIWSFRVVGPDHSQLGFAIIPVGDAKDSRQIN